MGEEIIRRMKLDMLNAFSSRSLSVWPLPLLLFAT